MRTPTPLNVQLAWWTNAVFGYRKIIAVGLDPQVGFFKRKLVSGGPFVPARIWMHQEIDEIGELAADEVIRCVVNGTERNPIDEWPYLWNGAITQTEYYYMEALRLWSIEHAPFSPHANPHARLDPLQTPMRF